MRLNDGLSFGDEDGEKNDFTESEAQQLVNETENLDDLVGLLSFPDTMNLAAAKLLKINSQFYRVPTEYILCVYYNANEPHRSQAEEILRCRYGG